MRALSVVLATFLIAIQYPLWLGKGGWLRVWELERQLGMQRAANGKLSERNDALAAEVEDLRGGSRAIEELARYDLGMVRRGEIFVRVNEEPALSPGGPRFVPSEVRTAATRFE